MYAQINKRDKRIKAVRIAVMKILGHFNAHYTRGYCKVNVKYFRQVILFFLPIFLDRLGYIGVTTIFYAQGKR